MSMQQFLIDALRSGLQPDHLQVDNESHLHRGGAGGESHFKVVVVSAQFAGERPLARHRRVHALLADAFTAGLHALALHTYTPDEWQKLAAVPVTPGCAGRNPHG